MVSKKNKLIFLLPPKTGSTSLEHNLKSSNIIFEKPQHYPKHPLKHLLLSELLNLYGIQKQNLFEYKIIQVVRNPYDRFVSSLLHQNMILSFEHEPSYYINNLIEYLSLLPNDCDKFYEKFYGSIEHKNISYERGNWGGLRFWYKQEWWNDVNADINYFKLEKISMNINELSDLINVKLNKLKHLKPNGTIRHRHYTKYFDVVTKNKFDALYESDIKKFNYEF